jgi:hypothetical protein
MVYISRSILSLINTRFTYILFLKSVSANHCHGRSNLVKDLEMCVQSILFLFLLISKNNQ